MKIKSNIDLMDFLKEVKRCEGSVYLETTEGDKLNLKSTLSQYVFVVLAGEPEVVKESELVCSEEDAERLKGYLEQ